MKTYLLWLLIALIAVFYLSGCARNKPVAPDGSKPSEYSAYLFSAANVLYYDNQFTKAEEIYRLALRYDPKSDEIRKAIFNAMLKRIYNKEIPLKNFEGYVDSLITWKAMDKLMLEQAYNVFAEFKENHKARYLLDIYMQKYETARAYTSLFYLEQVLENKTRPELLDKAYLLAENDAAFLNSLGYLYLSFDSTKAEKVWQYSRKYDATTQAVSYLWSLYASQKSTEKLLALWNSFALPDEKEKLNEVLEKAMLKHEFQSVIMVSDSILASDEPQFILKLLQAGFAAKDDIAFVQSKLKLQDLELSPVERQLTYFYIALYSINKEYYTETLNQVAKLNGKSTLDGFIIQYRTMALADKKEPKPEDINQIKTTLRKVIVPAKEKQLPFPVKDYLLAVIEELTIDNVPNVSDEISKPCVLWFYNNDRRTYDTYLWLAEYYTRTKGNINLKEVLRAAIDEYPENEMLLNWLGYSYVNEGYNLDEAEVLIRRALQLSPDNPFYLDSLAWLYFKKKEYKTALEYMEIPSQLLNMPSEIALHIAKILAALDEFDKAAEFCKIAIEAGDDPEFTAQAQDLLNKLTP